MRAGELRHRVTVQEPTETKGQLGDTVQAWTSRDEIWANVQPVSGKEKFSLMQEKVVADTTITMRADAAPYLTPKMRILFEGKVYDVEAVINENFRNRTLTVYCKTVQ